MSDLRKYKVSLHSKPGMGEHYKGDVSVEAEHEVDAIDAALTKLKRTSFPDRPSSSWVVDAVEPED